MRALLFLFILAPSVFAELPPDAVSLKSKRDAKIAEVNRTYVFELEKLKKSTMAKGDLAAANEIQKEIETITQKPAAATEEPAPEKWKWGTGGELTLYPDGTASHSKWAKPGKWEKVSAATINLESDTGLKFILTIRSSKHGVVKDEHGNTATTLDKID